MLLGGILRQTVLVVVASFVLVTVESQTVSVYPPNVGAQTGEQNVFLGCNVTDLPANTYIQWSYYPSWMMTGFTIYSTYNGINNDPTNFTVLPLTTVGDTQSLDLVINTAKPELATQYKCDLSPIVGHGKSIYVTVLDPVECSSSNVEYDEGDEANISCSVNFFGFSQTNDPTLTWYRDGQPISGGVLIDESNTRKTLTLTKNVTSADDDQEFVCVVDFANSNPTYTDSCSTVVYVRTGQTVSVYPPNVAAQTGEQNVFLGCNVTGLPANTYIEWIYYPSWMMTGFLIYSTYNGINNDPTNLTVLPMTTVGDTQSLDLVINTVKPELATQYTCDLSPIPGQGKSIHVIVLDPVECSSSNVEYNEGDEASISCSVNFFGYTPTNDPMLTWYKDGQPISGGVLINEFSIRKTLTLTKTVTSADDDQEFVCVVDFIDSNPTYTDNCSTVIHVLQTQVYSQTSLLTEKKMNTLNG